jgi:hypothetical protein
MSAVNLKELQFWAKKMINLLNKLENELIYVNGALTILNLIVHIIKMNLLKYISLDVALKINKI